MMQAASGCAVAVGGGAVGMTAVGATVTGGAAVAMMAGVLVANWVMICPPVPNSDSPGSRISATSLLGSISTMI